MIKKTMLGVAITLSIVGCSDWLKVDPVDSTLEDWVYATENNTQIALNGIYLKMANTPLYGQDLTNRAVEILAQRYAVPANTSSSNKLRYYMNSYAYSDQVVTNNLLEIWTEAYSTILNINYFIKKLNATEGIIPQSRKEIMLGEAHGLRAFIHFDMLRLFGPVYVTDSTALSIPYYNEPITETQPRETANTIMDKIFTDIETSLEYLKNDPVITEGAMVYASEDSLSVSQLEINEFYRFRNRRMNYYAVSTFKARALLYREDKAAALALALALLNDSKLSEHFPWVTRAQVALTNKEDRIASPEVLFGIHSPYMYSVWDNNFSPGLGSSVFTGSTQTNVNYAFDVSSSGQLSTSTDYRALNWANYSIDATYMTSYKFAKTTITTNNWNYQPLIRKTELYYIIAEVQNDIEYIDQVRVNRGLKKVSEAKTSVNVTTELLLENMREFQGEGQLFFYYKRRNQKTIRSGNLTSGTSNVTMDATKYVLPIPQVEIDN
ncbi:hypothetical protein GGR21_001551 [Dysgonomonas hofstadii]|uniref:SusD-like N-terminal domain-containing protein n=2 Tax=Dysgonomonas hofstadii TaxID=637886 RepID=A0A840CJW2_9BACT|nr:hypothetical protein [Dysgonomonas hofstadii]